MMPSHLYRTGGRQPIAQVTIDAFSDPEPYLTRTDRGSTNQDEDFS